MKNKSYKIAELKEYINSIHNKHFANGNTTTNIDNHVATIRGISTTFATNNPTLVWFDWLNNKVNVQTANDAIDGINSNNNEVIRVSNITKSLFNEHLRPLWDNIEMLQAVEEELSSVLMQPDPNT